VSVSTDGQEANSDSRAPNISADGRIVSFASGASNLVPNDANDQQDIFIHDRDSDGNGVFDEPGGTKTELVSVSLNGGAGNNFSWGPRLSGNGRFVTFFSLSSNLVAGDTNQCGVYDNPTASSTPGMCTDVFVRDLQTGKTVLADLSSSGEQANQAPDTCELGPDISFDGRFIVFQSAATNLVPGKTNMCSNNNFMSDQGPCPDIFLHDNQTGQTTRLSVGANGEEGDNESARPVIASNGRYVAFESLARNLVPGIPKNVGGWVVYVVDVQTGEIKIGSVNSKGQPVSGSDPIISDDGRFVGFHSDSYDIVSANPPEDSSRLDFYIHDFQTGLTHLVSQGTEGPAATGRVSTYDLSSGAKWAAFVANQSLTGSAMPACDNDVPGSNSSHECSEIYLRDLLGLFK
jgi:Tol biopolymer transport system component